MARKRLEIIDVAEPHHEELVELTRLRPWAGQQRKTFDAAKLEELARSIAQVGLLHRLIVRKVGEWFEIIAGERRFLAIPLANKLLEAENEARKRDGLELRPLLEKLPCEVRTLTDEQATQLQCIENAQRVDVSELEEARSFAALASIGRTQEEIARLVGAGYVGRRLSLLKLSEAAQGRLEAGDMSASHAAVLARLPVEAARDAAFEQLIVPRLSGGEELPPVREFAREVAEKYSARLADAKFDTSPCASCERRAANAWGEDGQRVPRHRLLPGQDERGRERGARARRGG
jgi:ParB-like chromosome segregation protein Spo0J